MEFIFTLKNMNTVLLDLGIFRMLTVVRFTYHLVNNHTLSYLYLYVYLDSSDYTVIHIDSTLFGYYVIVVKMFLNRYKLMLVNSERYFALYTNKFQTITLRVYTNQTMKS